MFEKELSTPFVMKVTIFPLLLLITILLSAGCSKQKVWIEAVIIDAGSPSVDGCGFLIEIEDQIYYPINLEEKYQVDQKRFKIRYVALEDVYTCGFPYSDNKFLKIEIREIEEW